MKKKKQGQVGKNVRTVIVYEDFVYMFLINMILIHVSCLNMVLPYKLMM